MHFLLWYWCLNAASSFLRLCSILLVLYYHHLLTIVRVEVDTAFGVVVLLSRLYRIKSFLANHINFPEYLLLVYRGSSLPVHFIFGNLYVF